MVATLPAPITAPVVTPAVPNIPIEKFYAALALRGLSVVLNDKGGVTLTGPAEKRNDGHRAYIKAHRDELIADLTAKAEGGDLLSFFHPSKGDERKKVINGGESPALTPDYSARNNVGTDSETITRNAAVAWEQANCSCFFPTNGYDEEDFQKAASGLYAAADALACPVTIPGLIRFAIDDPVPVVSDLLGDIILASDHCPVLPVHAGAVVYRPKEIEMIVATFASQEEISAYHGRRAALLSVWLQRGGISWVFEKEVRYFDKQADRWKIEEGSKINLETLATDVRLSWRTADALVDQLIAGGIVRAWTPDQYRRVAVIQRVKLSEQRAAEQRRQAAAAYECAFMAKNGSDNGKETEEE